MKSNYLATFLSILFIHSACLAQEASRYSININNGMPSNHVYYMIEDSHGYLWMATTNGVVRYNGYECKVYDLSYGLPTTDVWSLFEDARGRIWLADISHELGYIYRNEYHKTVASRYIKSFYPLCTSSYNDGIIFVNASGYHNYTHYICVCKSDSVQIAGRMFGNDTFCRINSDGKILYFTKDSLYSGTITEYGVVMKSLCPVDQTLLHNMLVKVDIALYLNDYLLECPLRSDSFFTYNIHTGRKETLKTASYLHDAEPIYLVGKKKVNNELSVINIFTGNNILQFSDDSMFTFLCAYPIRRLSGNSGITGSDATSFLDDSLWGTCLATSSNGLYVNCNLNCNIINSIRLDLKNYKYAGRVSKHESYWWNKTLSTLAIVTRDGHVTKRKLAVANDIHGIVRYNTDTCLLYFGGSNTFWYTPRNGRLVAANKLFGGDMLSAIIIGPRNVLTVSKVGFSQISWDGNNVNKHDFDADRYTGLAYDSLRRNVWAWKSDKVFIHFGNNTDSMISGQALAQFGIMQPEKIIIDNTYGNIFFKSNEKLVLYNPEQRTYTPLFEHYNFIGTSVEIYDHTLVVAGAFGVLFSKIKGVQKFSEPIVYNNVKNHYYNYVSDMQMMGSEALLNTDKGCFTIPIPPDSAVAYNTPVVYQHKYRLVVNYMDSTIDAVSGDTLLINQKKTALAFDFINPTGVGKVRYSYRMSARDTVWHELNENLLNLPRLDTGGYATLEIIAYDNVFRSSKITLYLFLVPYWWQTTAGRAGIIFCITLLFGIAVWATQRFVLKSEEKRNLRMEMELTSIYAQLNPHFIFNTLNSALLMVSRNKMEDAYVHISKFSKLLLAYLRSSRNKLISISDEVRNLRNYIELQQVRFKDKFLYEVLVDDAIDAVQVSIPSLLIQPFVENAINHGLLHKEKNGILKIEFKQGVNENSIICTISDNGVGRRRSKQLRDENIKDTSYGDDLIKGLVRIFNKYEKMNIEIKYTDLPEPETGTVVEIFINKAAYGK